MYIIIDSMNLVVDTTKNISYTKMQSNGVRILCSKDEAMSIYATDTDKLYSSSMHTAVKVEQIPDSFVMGFWRYNGDFYITEDKVEEFRVYKLSELSTTCNTAITSGCDVTLSDGTVRHFALTETDQINISTALSAVQQGAEGFPYHADGELCRIYSSADVILISNAAAAHKLYHTTYFNHLKAWLERAETAEEISAITYGSELPEDLAANMAAVLGSVGG